MFNFYPSVIGLNIQRLRTVATTLPGPNWRTRQLARSRPPPGLPGLPAVVRRLGASARSGARRRLAGGGRRRRAVLEGGRLAGRRALLGGGVGDALFCGCAATLIETELPTDSDDPPFGLWSTTVPGLPRSDGAVVVFTWKPALFRSDCALLADWPRTFGTSFWPLATTRFTLLPACGLAPRAGARGEHGPAVLARVLLGDRADRQLVLLQLAGRLVERQPDHVRDRDVLGSL